MYNSEKCQKLWSINIPLRRIGNSSWKSIVQGLERRASPYNKTGNVKHQIIVRNFRSWWYLFSCQRHQEFMLEESRERDVSNLNSGWGRTMTMTPPVSELLNISGSPIIVVPWLWASLLTLSSEIITAKRQMGSQPCNVILYSERKIKIQSPGGYSF